MKRELTIIHLKEEEWPEPEPSPEPKEVEGEKWMYDKDVNTGLY